MPTIEFTTMRALLTAVIAAIEAAAVALAVFALIGIPSVLIWWLGFDLGTEPADLVSLIAALWQLAHLVPMQLSVSAQAALGIGLPPAALTVPFSLAPLALTLTTAWLAYRSGHRFANRGGSGAWALLGGTGGFTAAAWFTGVLATGYTVWPTWARAAVPAAVYLAALLLGFVLRAARDGHDWWQSFVRQMQRGVAAIAPTAAASLTERAAETFRLTLAALAAVCMLGTVGFAVAIVVGYVDIIRLSQGLQLDIFGVFMLFVLQLLFLPTAWIWTIAWFAGSGFSVGIATSVTPFDTLLGPLPALPLFGAIPSSWGWAGGFAPVIVVAIGTVLGGLAGGRPLMRRASAFVSVMVSVCAAVFAGLVVALFCVLASGALGPGRLALTGPGWWQTGGLVAAELAFGMSLGVFARRFDVARLRSAVPASLRTDDEFVLREHAGAFDEAARDATAYDQATRDEDLAATMPIDPLTDSSQREARSRRPAWLRGRGRRGGGALREKGAAGSLPGSITASAMGSLTDLSVDEQPTIEIEPLVTEPRAATAAPDRNPSPGPDPDRGSDPEPDPDLGATQDLGEIVDAADTLDPVESTEPADAIDPLLKAFTWDAQHSDEPAPEQRSDWRSRMRSKWGRD